MVTTGQKSIKDKHTKEKWIQHNTKDTQLITREQKNYKNNCKIINKNDDKYIYINYINCKLSAQIKRQSDWIDTKAKSIYMAHTRD